MSLSIEVLILSSSNVSWRALSSSKTNSLFVFFFMLDFGVTVLSLILWLDLLLLILI